MDGQAAAERDPVAGVLVPAAVECRDLAAVDLVPAAALCRGQVGPEECRVRAALVALVVVVQCDRR